MKIKIFKINRAEPFDPVKFIGSGWNVDEEDKKALALTEIDFSKVRFEHGLKDGESIIDGEEKLKRLKDLGGVRLDARIGQALYKEKGQRTLRFLYDTFGLTWMEFAGTVLRYSDGCRCFLDLCRGGDGSWDWLCFWLGRDRNRGSVSPLLASKSSNISSSPSDPLLSDLERRVKALEKWRDQVKNI